MRLEENSEERSRDSHMEIGASAIQISTTSSKPAAILYTTASTSGYKRNATVIDKFDAGVVQQRPRTER